MEDRFNKKFQYDYVFLNEKSFDQSFKEWVEFFLFIDIRLIVVLLL
jgi:Glycolipid 2-alpha-mannosyltransferase